MLEEKYILRNKSTERIQELDQKYGTLIADILINRGINDTNTANRHINTNLEEEHGDPFLINDMEKAVDRIHVAIKNNEKTTIHCDYDCDGIPGAVILTSFFNKINYLNYAVSIPNRNIDGYGINNSQIDEISKNKSSLIITIDLGISAFHEISHANTLQIDTIITDHHTLPELIPDALAVVHPKLLTSTYPNRELCGAGVVYTLIRAFIEKYGTEYNVTKKFLDEVVDMASFATMSDMVELTIENKALIKEGMKKMRQGSRVGIQVLAQMTRVTLRDLTEEDVTFMITPKLNVASRMGNPYDAYNLLMEKDNNKAKELAEKLINLSNERKKLVALMVKQARTDILKWGKEEKELIVIGDPSWKIGLLGLVASKISEIFDKPTFVWGRTEGENKISYKGSCRGNGKIDVHFIMSLVGNDVLKEYGGHFEAGGFEVNVDKIYELEESLLSAIKLAKQNPQNTKTGKQIDAVLPVSIISKSLYKAISRLAPFGTGFPEPVFAFRNVKLIDIKTFGAKNAHLEIIFRNYKNETSSAYAFYTELKQFGDIEIGQNINVVGTLDTKVWQNTLKIKIKDITLNKND